MKNETVSTLLIPEYPLIILPSLAKVVGLNEAVVLQQVNYWLQTSNHEHEGRKWVYNSYACWQEQFPFWSLRTIQSIFPALEKKGLLISGNFNKNGFDRTKWYTINYKKLRELMDVHLADIATSSRKSCETHPANPANSSTETNTETTTENISGLAAHTPSEPEEGEDSGKEKKDSAQRKEKDEELPAQSVAPVGPGMSLLQRKIAESRVQKKVEDEGKEEKTNLMSHLQGVYLKQLKSKFGDKVATRKWIGKEKLLVRRMVEEFGAQLTERAFVVYIYRWEAFSMGKATFPTISWMWGIRDTLFNEVKEVSTRTGIDNRTFDQFKKPDDAPGTGWGKAGVEFLRKLEEENDGDGKKRDAGANEDLGEGAASAH